MIVNAIPPQTVAELRSIVEDACSDKNRGLPCASVVIVGRNPSSPVLFCHSAGKSGAGHKSCQEKINGSKDHETFFKNDIYWLASCTKLVTGIACMQLVEHGKLGLDDADEVERLCPELREVKVVQKDGSLIKKKKRITLRMLLTHTAGFGYSFLNPKLRTYHQKNKPALSEYDEFSGYLYDFSQPLVNQPGEMFEYGINLDWAGILVERATELKLNDYMQQNIFAPLLIEDLSMIPSTHMKDRLVGLWQRDIEGQLSSRKYPLSNPLEDSEAVDIFHSGGAGLFGNVRQFSKILSALLNDGTSPETGQQILRPETVKMMFTNQLPHQPDFARRPLPAVKPDLVYPTEELYPLCPASAPQGWGLSFMISPGVTGHSETTALWSGLSNVFWWCDRDKGVAGIVASQVLPFVDPNTAALWSSVETTLYKGLRD